MDFRSILPKEFVSTSDFHTSPGTWHQSRQLMIVLWRDFSCSSFQIFQIFFLFSENYRAFTALISLNHVVPLEANKCYCLKPVQVKHRLFHLEFLYPTRNY